MRKPFYVKSRKAWYVWHLGKQVRLATSEDEAYAAWEQLRCSENMNLATPVILLLDHFLDWVHHNRAARTYEWYKRHLEPFARHIGKKRKISELKPHHVTDYVKARHPKSSNDTIHGNIRAIQRAFNWGVRQGFLLRNPVSTIEKPRPTRREVLVSQDQFESMVARATDDAERDLLNILWETGCRPQEARIVEARHFDEPNARWLIPVTLSKGKQETRVVYLNEAALAITKRLSKLNPNGPIFRNAKGKPWTRNAIRCRFRKYAELDIDGLCATAFRHSWTTHALTRGVDALSVSILLGHKDTAMISRYYSHLTKNAQFLRDQVEKATSSRTCRSFVND